MLSHPITAATDPDLYTSFSNPKDNPAKGTKTCTINQTFGNESSDDAGSLFAGVFKDGTIGLAVADDTYPQTDAYYLINGKRYSGEGDTYVVVPAEPLFADPTIQYTYTNWPDRSDLSGSERLVGFKKSYDECIAFLRGAKPA